MAQRGRPRAFDRDDALRHAMELFWEVGYDGASIADLTAAMGIGAPSLYAAFGDKESLFREAVRLYDQTEGSEADRALLEGPTAQAAVRGMLMANVDAWTRPCRPAGCMIVLSAVVGPARSEQVRRFLAAERAKSVAALRLRLERGAAAGELPASIDLEGLAGFYVTVLHGLSVQARDGADRTSLTVAVDHAMRAWPTAGPHGRAVAPEDGPARAAGDGSARG